MCAFFVLFNFSNFFPGKDNRSTKSAKRSTTIGGLKILRGDIVSEFIIASLGWEYKRYWREKGNIGGMWQSINPEHIKCQEEVEKRG